MLVVVFIKSNWLLFYIPGMIKAIEFVFRKFICTQASLYIHRLQQFLINFHDNFFLKAKYLSYCDFYFNWCDSIYLCRKYKWTNFVHYGRFKKFVLILKWKVLKPFIGTHIICSTKIWRKMLKDNIKQYSGLGT